MTRLEQLEQIENEIREEVAKQKPKSVYLACNLSSATLQNFKRGDRISYSTLRKLATFVDQNERGNE